MKQIIGIYSVAGHRKEEVDHVGGVAMIAICQDIAFKTYFSDAEEAVTFLTEKLETRTFLSMLSAK